MNFIPIGSVKYAQSVPYFEDQPHGGDRIPGVATKRSLSELEKLVRKGLSALEAGSVVITPGRYQESPARYGCRGA